MIHNRHHQAGVAHLVLIGLIVLVIAGTLGFVAYNALQKAEVNAGGIFSVGTNKKTSQTQPITPVTVTFKATDWARSSSATVAKDATHGTVLRINKVGMAADKVNLASISASDSRFKQLNDYHYAASQLGVGKTTYTRWVCLTYQRSYTNQDIKKFPYVSTFQTTVGPFSIGGNIYDTAWHVKQCKSTKITPKTTGSGSLTDYIKAKSKGTTAKLFEIYKGFSINTKTTLPDATSKYKTANPAANGVINVGDLVITNTFDTKYRP